MKAGHGKNHGKGFQVSAGPHSYKVRCKIHNQSKHIRWSASEPGWWDYSIARRGRLKTGASQKNNQTQFRSDYSCPVWDLGSTSQAAFSFGSFIFCRNVEREKNTSARAVQRKIAVVTRFFAVKTVRARFYYVLFRLIKNKMNLCNKF